MLNLPASSSGAYFRGVALLPFALQPHSVPRETPHLVLAFYLVGGYHARVVAYEAAFFAVVGGRWLCSPGRHVPLVGA